MITRKGQDLLGLAALMAILAISSALAVLQIGVSPQPVDVRLNPSPLGYTFSLALFVVPCFVLGAWVWRSHRTADQRLACGFTLLALIPVGFLLDLFFGRTFLRFPNSDATLGILIPGYDLRSGWNGLWGPGWKPFLPLEEFAFYALGFVAILLAYIWGDEILFLANKVDDTQRTPAVFRGWKERSAFFLGVGAGLFGIAWLIRRHVPSETGHSFPGYFLFLLVGSIIPSLLFARVAFQFINWRALSLSWLFILTISEFWEASLGIAYGWWGYPPDQMMGVFIKPLYNLPVEAVFVWTLGSWTTVILYETILTALHAGCRGWRLLAVVNASEEVLSTVKRAHDQHRKQRR